MNLQKLKDMRACWPEGTPAIIGAIPTPKPARKPVRKKSKKKDYGKEYPQDSMTTKVVLSLGAVVVLSISFMAFWLSLPNAIEVEKRMQSGIQVVADDEDWRSQDDE